MTKGEKKYLITTGIIFLVGLILLIIGTLCGGIRQGFNLAKNLGNGAANLFSNFAGYENIGELTEAFDPFSNLDFDLSEIPSEGSEIKDFEKFDMEEVTAVKVLVAAGDIDIKETDGSKYGIDAEGKALRYFIKDATLYVTADAIDGTVYLPENEEDVDVYLSTLAGDIEVDCKVNAKSFDLYTAAGNVEIANLNAKNSKFELMAGNLEVANMDVETIEASVFLGNIELAGQAKEKIELSGIGNIELSLVGEETDYNYQLNAIAGNIAIDGKAYNGVNLNKKIDNGAECDVILSTNTGNIEISF